MAHLSPEWYKVLASGNGREALEIVREKRPDLVVLEIMLPEMDGWEVCRRLRRESDVPVIMLTARGGVSTGQVHEIGGMRIDPASREVWLKGKRLGLRTKEFDLLLALAEHRGSC